MTTDAVRLDLADRVLTITLSRPERLNAFDRPMMDGLIAAFDRADADDEVRAVVVTGAGRAFCAGADLGQGGKTFDYAQREDRGEVQAALTGGAPDLGHESVRDGGGRVTLRIFSCLKPVIAAVNGPAVGIGATMLLPMDVRLASSAARFGFVFTRRGITPEACSSWFLPRVVGIAQALEWTMAGRVFDAAEAERGGGDHLAGLIQGHANLLRQRVGVHLLLRIVHDARDREHGRLLRHALQHAGGEQRRHHRVRGPVPVLNVDLVERDHGTGTARLDVLGIARRLAAGKQQRTRGKQGDGGRAEQRRAHGERGSHGERGCGGNGQAITCPRRSSG